LPWPLHWTFEEAKHACFVADGFEVS
jgi:hypothetical protein